MNRVSISLLVGLVFFCYNLTAQKVVLEGQVLDSLNVPLELANVIAINKNTEAIASYGITDAQGRFRLNLKKDSLYTLKASYLGFETWEEGFQALTNENKTITLKASPNQLDGVTVTEDFPVTISGDTITYKTDAFTTGKEKKLENVLEQLPGFQIDDEGQIKVQGKDVSKVLVEGKEFFDGDTKMATKNIPANAVDKVQVLRDFNEVGPLGAVNDSDALALNIKLKEGKKNLWFGDISATAGPKERYLAHPNIFYYSPKFNINFIGDMNNIGKQAFSLQDYFRFNGGLSTLGKRSGSSLNLSGDDIGLSLMQNNRARNIDSKLAALNFNYNPNKKISFSGFGILSGVDTDLSSISQRTYIRDEGNNEETLESNTLQKNISTLLKISTTYTPNSKWYINYDGFLKRSEVRDENQLNSLFSNFSNDIRSLNGRDPFSVQQSLSAFYAKNDNNIFSWESNYLYKKQLPTYNLISTQQPFLGSVPLEGETPFNISQNTQVQTNTFDTEFNYYRVLNKTNHISFKLGLSTNGQRLHSEVSEIINGNSRPVGLGNQFINDTEFDFLDVYFGIGYRVKWKKLTIGPRINFHIYDIKNRNFTDEVALNKTLLLPSLNAKYAFNSSKSLQLNYSLEAEFADVQNLTSAIQLRGYNSLFQGNPNLRNAWYHNATLNFMNFNMFNFANIYGGMTYQKKFDGISSNVNFVGLDRVSSPINIDAPNEIVTFFGNYERRFPYWKGKLEARITYNKFNNIINTNEDFNRSFNQQYKLAFETKFKEAPNVELGFEKIWNDYSSSNIESRFITNIPFVNIEAYFLNGFALTADYQYNEYRNRDGGIRSTYDFLNATLFYQKEDSKWEFKITGLNLLNTTSIRQDAFSNNLISTLEYNVQPRYFVAGIKYEL
ncbi:carboxypeptidase regulatory-like domain-containing protein [Maribacter sp. 2308TA10-17]|uniref:carboxypeptidase regulatory-like domain-containing protein n=1 Tax=Maribacter sp. 2308TA10-17 TaxID=3386276 RepID=UPI0039BC2A7A